jgi:predicted O-linked N-acetylglucosamine transferase (SPINDLY family)
VPAEQAAHYAPSPLPIDGCYQANDGRAQALPVVTRATEGLPEDAFLLCCFNNFYKITPEVFASWMAILQAAPRAILWLTADNATGIANLRRQATAAGIAADRLVFASRCDPLHYLARLGVADLFLDTFPYNAGTVASDALRMGLPIVTLTGRAFASRMAASLLTAVGATDGIAMTHAEYVAKAVAIATEPGRHAAARAALAGDAWARSLGDTAGFAARMEAAYRKIRLRP